MLTAQSLLAWTVMSIGLVLLPGPDTMLVAGHAARRGLKAGMAAIGGIQLGGLFYMALCGFGFLSVLNAVPGLFMAVKVAGAIYLAWLGLSMLRGAVKPAPASDAPRLRIGGSPFTQGFISTVLNPKVAIFFLAALPQFVGTGPDAPWQGMALIAIVYALGFLWCALLAILATKAGRRVGQSSAMRWFEGAMGVGFFGLAGRLALARNV
ncbi:Lysine exporter protein (LYSE/YGGA) [Sphingobium chlorophenolicum L-1]|uniref:Lysine exporter protein (LYSE/YGGA) n=2 Tax=Sphingobium chlorophenolicum TaxID=46429 RepID=F6ETD4_SPHCR|nr:LysE family translocator [Sphingobium chlorophenolicum]AEG47771.1 Lysine exporter protein (LYSE/YGGA) [Sphingobium chlorophenolicum L-1]KEQ53609.1 Threonine transporter [Sphingobium chlorophenolicum]